MSRRASAGIDTQRLVNRCQGLAEDINRDTADLAAEIGMQKASLLPAASHKRLAEKVDLLARTDAKLEIRLEAMAKAMQKIQKEVDVRRVKGGDEEEDIKDYAAQILAQMEKAMDGVDAKVLQSKTYKASMKHIAELEDDDDDIVMQNGDVSLICPLTNAQFKTPMRSKKCGHTYESNAIQHHIKISKGSADCPVAGCSHRVGRADLEVDDKMERRLRIASHTQGEDQRPHETEEIDDDEHETYI